MCTDLRMNGATSDTHDRVLLCCGGLVVPQPEVNRHESGRCDREEDQGRSAVGSRDNIILAWSRERNEVRTVAGIVFEPLQQKAGTIIIP